MTREVKGIIGFISLTIIAITALGLIFSFNATTIALGGVLVFAFMVARKNISNIKLNRLLDLNMRVLWNMAYLLLLLQPCIS